MSRPHYVVVQDRDLAEGAILDSEVAAQQVEGRSGIVLPYSVELATSLGPASSTAYQRRAYGEDGIAFDGRAPKRGCPFPVYMSAESVRVAWIARVMNSKDVMDLRLAGAVGSGGISADVGPESIRSLHDRGEIRCIGGTWFVRGLQGHFAVLCLLGCCADLRVLWLAATVLPR